MKRHWSLVFAGALGLFGLASLANAQTPSPGAECGTPFPDPTPYPALTPPDSTEYSRNVPIPTGEIRYASTGDELQAAFQLSVFGDVIRLTQDIIGTLTFLGSKSGILFEAAGPGRVKWTGAPADAASGADGRPACFYLGNASGTNTIKGIDLVGSSGFSFGAGTGEGRNGGSGGVALDLSDYGTMVLIDCTVTGGAGGDGEPKTSCPGGASGNAGSGGAAWRGSHLHADLSCVFRGGDGGAAPDPAFVGCCVGGGVPGTPGLPKAPTTWTNIVDATPTPPSTPSPTRSPSPTASPTKSPSPSPSPTATSTPTPSLTPSASPSPSPSPTGPTPSETASPTPSPTGCLFEEPFSPSPPAYPPVTPPPAPQGARELGSATGATHPVANAVQFLAALGAAAPGDRIIITASFNVSATVTKSGLSIEGTEGGPQPVLQGEPGPTSVKEFYNYPGEPVLTIGPGVEVALRNLTLVGGEGGSVGQWGVQGRPGGNGGAAISIGQGAVVDAVGCAFIGGKGGEGEMNDYCLPGYDGYSGSGGTGGAAWDGTGALYADLGCLFTGGRGGSAPGSVSLSDCCIHAGGAGVSVIAYSPTQWVEFTAPTGPFENAAARAVGDFDGSGCVELADFLLLLDAWQTSAGGSVVGMTDFLALLDNWQTGAAC